MNLFERYGTIGLKDKGFKQGIEDATKQGKKFSMGLNDVIKSVVGLKDVPVAFNSITTSIDGAVSRYDTLTRFPKVMEQMGYRAEEAAASRKLSDGVTGLPTKLDDVTATAQKATVLTIQLWL